MKRYIAITVLAASTLVAVPAAAVGPYVSGGDTVTTGPTPVDPDGRGYHAEGPDVPTDPTTVPTPAPARALHTAAEFTG